MLVFNSRSGKGTLHELDPQEPDSLDPAPSDDVRLTLTSQVARLVDGHDQKAADEMRRRRGEPDDDIAGSYRSYPGAAERTPPG